MVECNLCEEKYSETHIEFHLVGVHGVAGPKEMYTSSEFISEFFFETRGVSKHVSYRNKIYNNCNMQNGTHILVPKKSYISTLNEIQFYILE